MNATATTLYDWDSSKDHNTVILISITVLILISYFRKTKRNKMEKVYEPRSKPGNLINI